eukprot:7932994-Pyramimonas_sp.AAC.2
MERPPLSACRSEGWECSGNSHLMGSAPEKNYAFDRCMYLDMQLRSGRTQVSAGTLPSTQDRVALMFSSH